MGCGGSSEAKYAASYQAVTGSSPQAAPKATKTPKVTEPEAAPQRAAAASQASQASTEDGGAAGGETPEEPEVAESPEAPLAWWSMNTDWIRDSSHEILAAYNFFFEHIGIRKGWRTPPFKREDVQGPFMAAAEVVAVVRHRIDEMGQGMVLRQLEGSSHDFLWGWSPEKAPNQADHLPDFFRGLVFATMSDANGLVEGLDDATLDYYVQSHPILESSTVLERIVTEDVLKKGPAEAIAESAAEVEATPEPAKAEVEAVAESTEKKEETTEKQEAKEPEAAEVKEAEESASKPSEGDAKAAETQVSTTEVAAAPLMLGNG
eukprot:s912_g12.t1